MMESSTRLLLTGFGPFGTIDNNPSSLVLDAVQYQLQDILSCEVFTLVLPVSYQRAPMLVDQALQAAEKAGQPFDVYCALGVHRGDYFRLETSAKSHSSSIREDVDQTLGLQLASTQQPHILRTTFNIDRLMSTLTYNAMPTELGIRKSDNAGGYVCEALLFHLLQRSQQATVTQNKRTQAIFIHVPKLEHCSIERQVSTLVQILSVILLD